MTRIRLNPRAVLTTVRDTFENRGYLWEPDGDLAAVASEGSEPVRSTAFSHKLAVHAEVDPDRNRIVLRQKTTGAAYAGAGAPFFLVRLNIRFARIAKRVREDLDAARLSDR